MKIKYYTRHLYVNMETGEITKSIPKDLSITIKKTRKRIYYETNSRRIVELTHEYRPTEYRQQTIQF